MRVDKKFFVTISISSIIIVAIVGIFSSEIYPMTFVNYKPIFKFQYNKNYEFANKYYRALKITDAESPDFENILQKIVLEGLVDNILIDKELNAEFKSGDLKKQIKNKISSMKEGEFQDILIKLTQFSSEDIDKYFFKEQAKFQILDEILKKENVNMADWILSERRKSKVVVLTKKFNWTGEEIEIK